MNCIKKENILLQKKYPNIIYRIAWYHKVIGKLYYATWNKIRNLYFTKEWVKKQNITLSSGKSSAMAALLAKQDKQTRVQGEDS